MKIIFIVIVGALIAWFIRAMMINRKQADKNKALGQHFLADNGQKEGVMMTASGLQYEILQAGTGEKHPSAHDTVTVHYHGTLIDGKVFDSSVDRGETISFGLNQVIKGWTEGVQLMVVGEKRRFFIPAELAYGQRAAGAIEPGSTLIFDIELFAINGDSA